MQGTLTFVDNIVDSTTGTIHLRGTFENPQNRLWPGLYVNILLTLSATAQRHGGARAFDRHDPAGFVRVCGESEQHR